MNENPNAFKNLINKDVTKKIAFAIQAQYPPFNSNKFLLLNRELEKFELKQRVKLITQHLKLNLDLPYPEALEILIKAMEEGHLKGFELWPFSEFISQFGLSHFDSSLKALYRMTERFTAEFAIRPYLLQNHKRVLKFFTKWAKDKNVHVRRWVSEGTRPLLPWGERIPLFVMDPTHTLFLLDQLKYDEELYVRKSVANHLNDISKNHPQVVIKLLQLWEKDAPPSHKEKLEWIKRHALRTLIKKGDMSALKVIGVTGKPNISISKITTNKSLFNLHDHLIFNFQLESQSKKTQKIVVDYVIDFIKSNGKMGKKVFKLKTLELKPGEKRIFQKKHSLKPITTMKYYSGTHHLMIQINGEIMGQESFYLEI